MNEIELKYKIKEFPENLYIIEVQKIVQDYLYTDHYSAIRKRKVEQLFKNRDKIRRKTKVYLYSKDKSR